MEMQDFLNKIEKQEEEEKVLKFQEEEKNINLFNQRFKEDCEQIENIEKTLINRIVIIKQSHN